MPITNSFFVRLSNWWVVSGKVMTVISLIIVPLLIIISYYYIYQLAYSKVYYELDPQTGKLTIQYREGFLLVLDVIAYIQIIVFFFILLVYPPYPVLASIERYFKERGYKKAVDEYEFIKKVLYVVIPLVFVFGIWSTETVAKPIWENTVQIMPPEFLKEIGVNQMETYESPDYDTLYVDYPALLLILVFVAAVFKMLCIRVRKDFRLYYAKGCFVICQ